MPYRTPEKEREKKRRHYLKNREQYLHRSWLQRQTDSYKAIQPARSRRSLLKRRYGITVQYYDDLLASQNYCCAICEIKAEDALKKYKVKYLDVDHCHQANKVRGLLCRECNVMLGNLEKPKDILKRAYKYIAKHKKLHLEFDPK